MVKFKAGKYPERRCLWGRRPKSKRQGQASERFRILDLQPRPLGLFGADGGILGYYFRKTSGTLKMGVARAGWTAKRAAHVYTQFSSVQSLSRVRLCDPTNCSTPGFPVHHQLPEFTQTHVHRVSDAVQSSHPLSSPSPPAPNPSQHQSLFQ